MVRARPARLTDRCSALILDPMELAALILAAGKGTRMKSALPKVLHPICGRPMLAYVVNAAVAATGARPLVVISPATEAVREAFAESADFAIQDQPRGTADAVRAALEGSRPPRRPRAAESGDDQCARRNRGHRPEPDCHPG